MSTGDWLERRLDEPEQRTSKCVILVPGSSGNALSDHRYAFMSEKLRERGMSMLSLEIWNEQNLNSLTLHYVFNVLDEQIQYLKSLGYDRIGIIGKSLGGALVLLYENPAISAKVLLAPAMTIERGKTAKDFLDLSFSQIHHIKADPSMVKPDCDILIIHGTDDRNISVDNSRRMIKLMRNAVLDEIEGTNHSFNEEWALAEVTQKTVDFFDKEL